MRREIERDKAWELASKHGQNGERFDKADVDAEFRGGAQFSFPLRGMGVFVECNWRDGYPRYFLRCAKRSSFRNDELLLDLLTSATTQF